MKLCHSKGPEWSDNSGSIAWTVGSNIWGFIYLAIALAQVHRFKENSYIYVYCIFTVAIL